MNKICGIYGFKYKEDDKWYIGQSIDIWRRYKDHKNQYRKNHGIIDILLHDKGFDSFEFYILEVCPSDKITYNEKKQWLNEKEKFYIEKYDSFQNGYNCNKGGSYDCGCSDETRKKISKSRIGKPSWNKGIPRTEELKEHLSKINSIPILQFSLGGKYINEFSSAKQASIHIKSTHIFGSHISQCCKHNIMSSLGYIWVYKSEYLERGYELINEKVKLKHKPVKINKIRKGFHVSNDVKEIVRKVKSIPIVQLTLSNEFIQEFSSAMEAGRNLKGAKPINIAGSICKCCKHKITKYRGFKWMYSYEYYNLENKTKHVSKFIIQLDLDGNYITEYPSAYFASKLFNDTSKGSCIRRVCQGKQQVAHGFKWMYKEDWEKINRKVEN